MPAQIVFNGKTYHSLDEMPPEVRQAYQQVMGIFADQDQNGVPDLMEDGPSGMLKGMGGLLADDNRDGVPDVFENAHSSAIMHTASFVVDGKTYHSLDEMPAVSPNPLPSLIEPESTDWRLPLAGCVIFVLVIAVAVMAFLMSVQR